MDFFDARRFQKNVRKFEKDLPDDGTADAATFRACLEMEQVFERSGSSEQSR